MLQDKEILYFFETLTHVMGRLSFLEDDMANGRIQATDAAELLGEENERLANLCESLKVALVGPEE